MLITVFTPTYNRAEMLRPLYRSLRRQSFHDFEWLIVDDGSTDDTIDVVRQFVAEGALDIRYIKKENGGKHTAVNLGAREARGELFFIVDSDDELPKNALRDVCEVYEGVRGDASIGGVCGLMAHRNGEAISRGLPSQVAQGGTLDASSINLRYKYGVTGDLREVFRTSVMREFPFPEIAGELFCPEALVWNRIAQKYKLRLFNKVIYLADYLGSGLTAQIVKIRMLSPVASMMTYAELSCLPIPWRERLKAAINYWRFRLCLSDGAKHRGDYPRLPWQWAWTRPLGWLMHVRDKRSVNKKP